MDNTFYVQQGLAGVHVKAWDFVIEGDSVLVFRDRNHRPLRAFRTWNAVEKHNG